MGERDATTQRPAIDRDVLRVRTIAVTFAAAVRSAHRDLDVEPAERDALVEAWRAWCLETLDGYAAEAARLVESRRTDATARRAIEAELQAAYRTVRGA